MKGNKGICRVEIKADTKKKTKKALEDMSEMIGATWLGKNKDTIFIGNKIYKKDQVMRTQRYRR